MELLAITSSNLDRLLAQLAAESGVYVPRLDSRGVARARTYRSFTKGSRFGLSGMVLDQSLKEFLLPPREKLPERPSGTDEDAPAVRKFFVCGAKACDLAALKCLDAVFGGEREDERYAARRKAMVVISSDCPEPDIFCHCTLLGGGPWPAEGFDVNLSPVEYGYVAEFGSDEGRLVAEKHRTLFTSASDELVGQRDESRQKALKRLESQNRSFELSKPRHELVRGTGESSRWKEHVETCVQCSACVYACPTSCDHLEYEQRGAALEEDDGSGGGTSEALAERVRTWDASFRPGFPRKDGGEGARPALPERFGERLREMFGGFFEKHGMEACTGCGRCIRGCPGRIDIREVLKALDG